jgi:flagellar motor switch protein FliN/FliY
VPDQTPGAWLAAEFATQIGVVLESMAGAAPKVAYEAHEISEAERATAEESLLWWEQPFNLDAEAMVWIGAAASAWEGIGGRVLRSAGVDDVDRDSARSTYLEILTQTLSGLAQAVSGRAAKEVSCGAGRESAPGPGCPAYSFAIAFPDLELQILAGFHSSLADLPEPPAAAPETQPASAPKSPLALAVPNSIDLLLDVELPVSVSFGRTQLALKDVIKLTTGSIVELNRSVTEPVEVIVNNCVIARGEVVVVEGNFGIRIKQVISRQERLRTLH